MADNHDDEAHLQDEIKRNVAYESNDETLEQKQLDKSDDQRPPGPLSTRDSKDESTNRSSTLVAEESLQKKSINISKYFLYTLVAGLIISALISVVAVLTGDFNSTLARALGTTGSMVAHTLIALFLISVGNRDGKTAGMFINTLLLITIGSFITSVLGIWEVITGRAAGDMYLVLFYTFCASLWIQLLLKVGNNKSDKPTRIASLTGIGFTGLFYVLLLPTVFVHYPEKLPEFHYRALAATVIVLATVSVLTTVFHRIHAFRHQEERVKSKDNGMDVLLAVVVVFIGLPIIAGIMSTISSYSYSSTYNSEKYAQREALERERADREAQENREPYEKVASERKVPLGQSSVDGALSYTSCEVANRNLQVVDSFFEYQSANNTSIKLSTRGSTAATDYMDDISIPYYPNTIATYDNECKVVSFSSLKNGDAVRLYYYQSDGEVRMLQDEPAGIQIVPSSITDS